MLFVCTKLYLFIEYYRLPSAIDCARAKRDERLAPTPSVPGMRKRRTCDVKREMYTERNAPRGLEMELRFLCDAFLAVFVFFHWTTGSTGFWKVQIIPHLLTFDCRYGRRHGIELIGRWDAGEQHLRQISDCKSGIMLCFFAIYFLPEKVLEIPGGGSKLQFYSKGRD